MLPLLAHHSFIPWDIYAYYSLSHASATNLGMARIIAIPIIHGLLFTSIEISFTVNNVSFTAAACKLHHGNIIVVILLWCFWYLYISNIWCLCCLLGLLVFTSESVEDIGVSNLQDILLKQTSYPHFLPLKKL